MNFMWWMKTSWALRLKRRRLLWMGGLVVGLIAVVFSWALIREIRFVLAQPFSSWTEDVTADCAVVLTGGPNRVREGFDLLARKAVHKLIISGAHPQAELREIFPLLPYYGEIRDQDVVIERRSRTTYGNAQQTYALVEAIRCRDIILVTSRVHMYRSLQTFRAQFPQDFPIWPRPVIGGAVRPEWDEVLSEALKSLFYSIWAY